MGFAWSRSNKQMLLNSSLGPLASNIRLGIVTMMLIVDGYHGVVDQLHHCQLHQKALQSASLWVIIMIVLGGAKAEHKRVNSGLGTQRTRAAKV